MFFTKKEIEEIIIGEILELYNIKIVDVNENLLNPKFEIPEADFIYLFENLWKKYNINVYSVIAKNNYKNFTINGLAEKIIEEQK